MGVGDTGKAPDLRAFKRDAVRQRVAETVLTAFAERGFAAVTAADAAATAGISRATFFRYFSSKEEVVFVVLEAMGDEISEALARRPAGEDAWTALRRALDAPLRRYEEDPRKSLARVRLMQETPALRAHQLEMQAQWKHTIGATLGPRIGEAPDSVRTEALIGAALAGLDAAIDSWAGSDGQLELPKLIDEAFAAIDGTPPPLA
jgi:AcrR family transcriptional regulator